jgi:hypothetical protein
MKKRKKILTEEIGYAKNDLEFPANIFRELFQGNALALPGLPVALAITLIIGLCALGRVIIGH